MRIALIGYGKMGQTIEGLLRHTPHEISGIISSTTSIETFKSILKHSDVAIEFTNPEVALANVRMCLAYKLPVVCGSTGWLEKQKGFEAEVQNSGGGFFYASNFSIAVNMLFSLNERLASMMSGFPEYRLRLEEIHHVQKKDAPSGTAISLSIGITANHPGKKTYILGEETDDPEKIPIAAIRREDVIGIHHVRYESEIDRITLSHEAKSRNGFALGAIRAAEWMDGRIGYYGMKDMLNL